MIELNFILMTYLGCIFQLASPLEKTALDSQPCFLGIGSPMKIWNAIIFRSVKFTYTQPDNKSEYKSELQFSFLPYPQSLLCRTYQLRG